MSLENLVDKHGRPLMEIWPQVRQFQDVQDVLDRNRLLIAEINHNHQLGTNVALERNVPMLRELNSNIAKVVQSYKDAADSFVTALFPQGAEGDAQGQAQAMQQQMPVPSQAMGAPYQGSNRSTHHYNHAPSPCSNLEDSGDGKTSGACRSLSGPQPRLQ